MTESQKIEYLTERITRLEKKLRDIEKQKSVRRDWVKVTKVVQLTGWTKEQLRSARENEEIEYKKNAKGFFYNLSTLNPLLLKKHAS